jgi:arginine deiminase
MSNKQQTAVDWLIEQLYESITLQSKHIEEIKAKAKEMEKQQMIQFAKGWMWNIELSDIDKTLEQYYNETFES